MLHILNLFSYSYVKLHEAAQLFIMVHYVRKLTVKKLCKNGESGSFEQLLFLLENEVIWRHVNTGGTETWE